MSDNRTIDGNGKAHHGAGLAEGGGEFAPALFGEHPTGVSLVREMPAIDLSGFPVGTIETPVGFAALHLGERVATVSGVNNHVNVTVENPFDNGTLSYIRGGHTDYEVALTEATVSAALGQYLVETDPELARSISSLRYLDDSNAIAVQLKETDTIPARLMVIDLPDGTVTVHAADAVGDRVSDPEWCIQHMAGPSSAHGVAAHLADVIGLETKPAWTAEEHDSQVQNEFVARVLTPLMTMPAHELGRDTNISRVVANEKDPQVLFSGFRHPSIEDDQHAANAISNLNDHLRLITDHPYNDAEFHAGEVRGFATNLAAVRLAGQDPTAAEFETERESIVDQIASGTPVHAPADVTVSGIERATALMLKSVQRDIHTKTPDRTGMIAADTVLGSLSALGSNGLFTLGRAPAGAVTRIIVGMPLSADSLLDHDTDDAESFSAPRRKPILGIWQ